MYDLVTNPQMWVAFLTLTALELVLGIDNIIFISILVDKLPPAQRVLGRTIGLALAMVMRLGFLLVVSWIVGLTEPLFTVTLLGRGFSGRDLILIAGGLFLTWKSTREIHEALEGSGEAAHGTEPTRATVASVVAQIMIIDLVFSIDSIITAVGMVDHLGVIVAAVVASVGLMVAFAGPIGSFVSAHPTIKMLALSFLVVIGVVLIADGFGHHVPRGYIYFSLAFSVGVEMLNLRVRKRSARRVERGHTKS
jgi:predicted tellurium resistance membrane protein TerC